MAGTGQQRAQVFRFSSAFYGQGLAGPRLAFAQDCPLLPPCCWPVAALEALLSSGPLWSSLLRPFNQTLYLLGSHIRAPVEITSLFEELHLFPAFRLSGRSHLQLLHTIYLPLLPHCILHVLKASKQLIIAASKGIFLAIFFFLFFFFCFFPRIISAGYKYKYFQK